MPVETRKMEHVLATIVDGNKALFNDSAIAHIEHSLTGHEFCLAGVSSHIKTHDLEWFILHCGGTLSKVVTDNTHFLIRGSHVGDTMHKQTSVEDLQIVKDAVEKNVPVLTTLEFFQLIGNMNPEISIQNLVDGWHEHITFSLRDTSAYGLSDRHEHKYSLERAKSNRSRCHGHCKGIIPAGDLRLKACFDPLSDSFVYFRCLKCITPMILDHIEKEWKSIGHGDGILNFAKNQSDEVLRMFQTPGADPADFVPTAASMMDEVTVAMRDEWAKNLANFLTTTAFEETARRQEERRIEKECNIPICVGGISDTVLGKRTRHDMFSSAEMRDFMQSIPLNVVTTSSEKQMYSLKESGSDRISPKIPTALSML